MRRSLIIVAALITVGLPGAGTTANAAVATPAHWSPAAGPHDTDPTRTPVSPAYTVNLTSDETGGVWTGRESVSVANASATPLTEVYLRLWDNAHGTCANMPIVVSKVTGGVAAAPTVNCTAMKVTLPAALGRNASTTVAFDLTIMVPPGIDRFGHDGSYYFLGNALPVVAVRDGAGWHLDPYTQNGESFYSLISDFDVTLDHPTTVKVPATGTSADRPGASGRTVTTATARKVRDFAWAAGPFREVSGRSDAGVHTNVYAVSSIGSGYPEAMLTAVNRAVDAHANRFGAYPYGEVDIVLDNGFWFGGMEYPGFILDKVSRTALTHELAHQWWYGVVGDDEYTTPWLDEGFADYATDLFFGDTGTRCTATWQSPDEKITNSMAYWDQHPTRYATVVYGYGKCALHDLQRLLGDATMAHLLASYAQAHWYGVSTVADFKAAAQQAAGNTDLTSFWTQHRVEG